MDRPVGYEAFSHVVFFRLRNNQGFLTTAIDEETDHDAVLRPTLHMFCGTFRLFITNVNGFVKRVRLYVQDEADLTLLHMMHHDLILRVYAFREIKSGSPADPS